MAALLYTGEFWPGILFVIGAAAIVEGLVKGRGWYALQAGAWMIGLGIWALMEFRIWFLFVMLGISVLMGAFVPPPMLMKKPAPAGDPELE
jgi:hypothetical protein